VIEVKPTDRVLLLTAPAVDDLRALAAKLTHGIAVCVAEDSARISELRRGVSDYENVMVTPADDAGALPWKSELFTVVYAPEAKELSAEALRVLSTGGTAHVAGGTLVKR
jgi:hypothetical protein